MYLFCLCVIISLFCHTCDGLLDCDLTRFASWPAKIIYQSINQSAKIKPFPSLDRHSGIDLSTEIARIAPRVTHLVEVFVRSDDSQLLGLCPWLIRQSLTSYARKRGTNFPYDRDYGMEWSSQWLWRMAGAFTEAPNLTTTYFLLSLVCLLCPHLTLAITLTLTRAPTRLHPWANLWSQEIGTGCIRGWITRPGGEIPWSNLRSQEEWAGIGETEGWSSSQSVFCCTKQKDENNEERIKKITLEKDEDFKLRLKKIIEAMEEESENI